MSRNWKLFIQDLELACTKIRRYTSEMDFKEFMENELVCDAVLRNLEIIGEAAKKIPPEVRQANPEIAWKEMSGLRDILAHAYFSIDDTILWDIIENEIPNLLKQIKCIKY